MPRFRRSSLLLPLVLVFLCSCLGGESSSTDPAGDETAPTVLSSSIADGATDVPLDVIIEFVFSEAMDPSSADGQVWASSGFPILNWTDAQTLAVEIVGMEPGMLINLGLETGLSDLAGNGLADSYMINFDTESGVPALIQQMPAHGAVDVSRNTQVSLQFSFDMNLSSLVSATTIESTPTALVDEVDFVYTQGNEGWVFISFPEPLPATSLIEIEIADWAYSDVFGIALDAPISFSFTTGDQLDGTPPTLLSMEPANGSTVPASTASVVFTFDEPIDPLSVQVSAASAAITALIDAAGLESSWSGDFTQLTMPLPTPLPAGLPIAVTIDGFADPAGNTQTTPIDYRIDVEGEGDPWPFTDGSRFNFATVRTITPDGGAPFEENFNFYYGVNAQPGGDLHWTEYDWEDYVQSSGYDIYRKTAATLEVLGWNFDNGADHGTLTPGVVFAKFPFAVQSWNGSSDATTSDGDFTVDYEVDVIGRVDVPATFGGDGLTLTWLDCWEVNQSLSLKDGGVEFASEEVTVWYAPAVGVVKRDAMQFEEDETVHEVQDLIEFSN